MNNYGPTFRIFSLLSVDLDQEAEDATGLLRDSVIRPTEVLIVPDGTRQLWLEMRG